MHLNCPPPLAPPAHSLHVDLRPAVLIFCNPPAGNYAGHVGAILAFIVGFFNTTSACGWKAGNIIDAIPADLVANIILATAAAVGAGIAGSLVTGDGLQASAGSVTSVSSSMQAALEASVDTSCSSQTVDEAHLSPEQQLSVDLQRLKIGGSDGIDGSRLRLLTIRPVSPDDSSSLSDTDSFSDVSTGSDKCSVSPVPAPKQTALAAVSAARAFSCLSSSRSALSKIKAVGSGAAAVPAASEQLLILHAGSSTTYPVTIMESWNLGLMSYSAKPLAYRMALGLPQPLPADYVPDASKLATCNRITGWKVWAVANALR